MKKLTVSVALSILLCGSAFAGTTNTGIGIGIGGAGGQGGAGGSASAGASSGSSASSNQSQGQNMISVGNLAAPDNRQPYSDEGAYLIPNAFGGYSFIVKGKPAHIDPRIDLPAGAVPPPSGVIEYRGELPQNFKGKIIGE